MFCNLGKNYSNTITDLTTIFFNNHVPGNKSRMFFYLIFFSTFIDTTGTIFINNRVIRVTRFFLILIFFSTVIDIRVEIHCVFCCVIYKSHLTTFPPNKV